MSEIELLLKWLVDFLPQLAVAILCGAMLGFERQSAGSPIGILTCSLVCVGATSYMSSGHLILQISNTDGDPTRIAGQIITGIGFLGAGAIIRGQGSVSGLSSAATIWFIGAVGILVGCRLPVAGLLLTSVVAGLSPMVRRLESRLARPA